MQECPPECTHHGHGSTRKSNQATSVSLSQVTYWQVWSALSLCPRSLQPHRPALPTTHPTPTDTPSLPQTTTILHPLTPRPLLLSFIHLTLRVLCDALFSCSIAHSPFDSAVWYCIHPLLTTTEALDLIDIDTHTDEPKLIRLPCLFRLHRHTDLCYTSLSTLPSTRRRSAHHNILLFLGFRLDVLSLQRQRNHPAPALSLHTPEATPLSFQTSSLPFLS